MRDTRRARLILGLLLAVALILITVDHRAGNDHVLGPVRGFVGTVFGKAERVGAAVTRPITGFVGMLRDAPSARRVITDLRKENARLRDEVSAQRLDRARAEKLDRMLGLAGLGRYRVVGAQVVARRTVAGFEDTVEIDAGTGDGIRPDMTVLSDVGLVGRIVHAGPVSSTVALLTDPALSAGARLEGGNELGVVSGLGEAGGGGNLVRFRLLDSTVPIGVGRRIVSFGSQQSRPYVPGVPIGVVERVDNTPGEVTRTAYARPFTDFSSLDVVGVVVAAPKRDPRDAVLPPKPQPPKPAREDRQRRGDDGRGQGRASLEAEWGLGDRGRGTGEARPGAAQDRRARHGTQAVDGEVREPAVQEPRAGRETGPAATAPRHVPREHDGAVADDGRGGRN
ncbi:rod shape-determining protein MreC [Microbispora sp. ZYX-F-249]|uniref:Cell shape-determining protein MreC n=1 Tax=Microbispora maris TaxID=3144104 RepID=A0ABV0AMK1_9ACTN